MINQIPIHDSISLPHSVKRSISINKGTYMATKKGLKVQ